MRRWSIYLWLWLCLVGGSAPALFAQDTLPAEVLANVGLARLAGTNIWALRREHDLRARLNEIPEHRQTIAALEQALSDRIEQNFRQWTTAQQADKVLALQLAALPADNAARAAIDRQRAQLQSQMIAPDRLGNQDDVRKQLVELTNRRNALWLALASVRHEVPKLSDAYAPLAKEPQLLAALRKLGGNHRLGPAKDYVDEVRKISDFDRTVLTDWVPMYWHGGHQRVSALVNESTPVTFSWSTSPEPTVITSAMAHAAGISVPPQAPRVAVALVKNRTYQAARINIAYLRLGQHLLRDVETLVLPPEGEDLGARLSVAAFSGFRAQTQPERLRLLIEAAP